jgi:membrane protein implicated in regulation of membrane protease activity
MPNQQPEIQIEPFLAILIGAFALAFPVSLFAFGLGLLFFGVIKAVGLGLIVLLIAMAYFTRKLVKQYLNSKK